MRGVFEGEANDKSRCLPLGIKIPKGDDEQVAVAAHPAHTSHLKDSDIKYSY